MKMIPAPSIRNVRGDDLVVYMSNKKNYICQLKIRTSYSELVTQIPGPVHYLVNKNVNNLPQSLRGDTIYADGMICVVVKLKNTIAKVLQLYPYKRDREFYIDFCVFDGYFLQKINSNDPHSIITMSINGPTIVSVPQYFPTRLLPHDSEPFIERSLEGTDAEVQYPETIPVVYVKDNPLRKFDESNGCYFRFPYLDRFDECPTHYYCTFIDVSYEDTGIILSWQHDFEVAKAKELLWKRRKQVKILLIPKITDHQLRI